MGKRQTMLLVLVALTLVAAALAAALSLAG